MYYTCSYVTYTTDGHVILTDRECQATLAEFSMSFIHFHHEKVVIEDIGRNV